MSQFYDEMDQLVIDMLKEFGTDMKLTRTDDDGNLILDATVRGVFTDPNSYRIRPVELDGRATRIVIDSRVKPLETDNIRHARGYWNITRVDIIQPADKPLGYRLEVKDNA